MDHEQRHAQQPVSHQTIPDSQQYTVTPTTDGRLILDSMEQHTRNILLRLDELESNVFHGKGQSGDARQHSSGGIMVSRNAKDTVTVAKNTRAIDARPNVVQPVRPARPAQPAERRRKET